MGFGGVSLSLIGGIGVAIYLLKLPSEQTLSGKECALYLGSILSPAFLGIIPLATHNIKETYNDIKNLFYINE